MKHKNVEVPLFDLDPARLDEHWTAHSREYHRYAQRLADARAEWERAKADRDVVQAELDRAVRRDPASYGVEKVTETVVERTILIQRGYQKAHDRVIEAKHTMDVLQATVDALEHRKRALEKLVELFLSDYWSQPRAKGEGGRRMGEVVTDAAFGGRKR